MKKHNYIKTVTSIVRVGLFLGVLGISLVGAGASVKAAPVDDTYKYVCTDAAANCPKGLSQLVIKSSSGTTYKYVADSSYEFKASNGDSIVVIKSNPAAGIYNQVNPGLNFQANMTSANLFTTAVAVSPEPSARGSFAVKATVTFAKADSSLAIDNGSAIANVGGDVATNTNGSSLYPQPDMLTQKKITYKTAILSGTIAGRTYKVCIRAAYINNNDPVCKNVKAPAPGERKTVTFDVNGSIERLRTLVSNTQDSNLETCSTGRYQGDPALCHTDCTDDDCNFILKYVNPVINKFLAPLAVLAVVIGVIWGAITYSMSGGDPQKAAQGKNRIQKSLIGLLAFIFLYALLNWLIPGGV